MKQLPLLFLLLALLFVAQASAQSSVWKVTDGESTLYLGGTCHLLRPADFPLPAEFNYAYQATDSLVFEIDPTVANDPAFAMTLLAKSRYSDGRSLKTVLSDEAYDALATQARTSGLPIEMLDGLKPGMAVMMLTIQELTRAGVTSEGVDLHYAKRGKADGKTIAALETPDFQIDLIANMGEGKENELILYGLQDLDQIKTGFDQLIRAWRSGNMEALEALFIEDMRKFPEIYAALLSDRNANWIPQIKAMFETPETEFVLVGVGHIPGPDGLLTLLEKEGYTITQINSSTD